MEYINIAKNFDEVIELARDSNIRGRFVNKIDFPLSTHQKEETKPSIFGEKRMHIFLSRGF